MEIKITADDKLISAINNLADALKLNPFLGNTPGQKSEPVKAAPAPAPMVQQNDTAMAPQVAKAVNTSQSPAAPVAAPVATPSTPTQAISKEDVRAALHGIEKSKAKEILLAVGASKLSEVPEDRYADILKLVG